MQRVVDTQLTSLQGIKVVKIGLPDRKVRTTCDGVLAWVADNLFCGSGAHHVDDIVERVDGSVGCVLACFERDDGLFALRVEIFDAVAPPMRFVRSNGEELWPAEEVRGALAWRAVRAREYDILRS